MFIDGFIQDFGLNDEFISIIKAYDDRSISKEGLILALVFLFFRVYDH